MWAASGLAAFVWAVSLVGIAFEAFWTYRPRWISAVLYVALGWSIVFFIPTLFAELAPAGFWLLVAGGISYTVGAVFYIFKKVRYMHSIFHLFVLAASCLQILQRVLLRDLALQLLGVRGAQGGDFAAQPERSS